MRLSGWTLCPSLPVAKVVLPPAAVLRAVFLFSPFVDFPSTKQLSPHQQDRNSHHGPPRLPIASSNRSVPAAASVRPLSSSSTKSSCYCKLFSGPEITIRLRLRLPFQCLSAHRPPPTAHSRPRSKPFLPSYRLLDHILPAFAVLSSPLVQIYLQHDACLGGSSPVLLVLGANLPARRHHPLPSSFSSFSSFSPSRHHSAAISPHPLLIA